MNPCCPKTLLNPLAVPADLMMGLPVTEDLYSIFSKEKEHEEKEIESQRGAQEQVGLLLQTYMQLLLPDDEKFHGGWALINCDMRLVASCPVPSYNVFSVFSDGLFSRFSHYPPALLMQTAKTLTCCCFCLTKPITLLSKSDIKFTKMFPYRYSYRLIHVFLVATMKKQIKSTNTSASI